MKIKLGIYNVFMEIRNYFYVGKTLRKASKTEKWKDLNLRKGWFNVAYTVVNLPPEVYESEEIYWRTFVVESLRPVNEYFDSLNLSEVVSVEVEDKIDKENGEFAYLVKYEPIFRTFSFWWILKNFALIGLLVWAQVRFELVEKVYGMLRLAFEWAKI